MASNGSGRSSPATSSCLLLLASSINAGDSHSSANSNVFGTTASRTCSRFGCQQVASPASRHSRSLGKVIFALVFALAVAYLVLRTKLFE